MDHRAGEGPGNARHELHLTHNHLAEFVDVVGLGEYYDVVRAGHGVHPDDSHDVADRGGHVTCLSHLGLDEDVRLDHDTTPFPPQRRGLAVKLPHRTVAAG